MGSQYSNGTVRCIRDLRRPLAMQYLELLYTLLQPFSAIVGPFVLLEATKQA